VLLYYPVSDATSLMKKRTLSSPTVDDVRAAEKKFDEENGPTEWLLTQLFHRFHQNTDWTEVLLKTKVLNLLYSTNIRAVNIVAIHISGLVGIDAQLAAGSPDVVDLIAKVKFGDKTRNNFSFASKYCNWHYPKAYPIYDTYVEAALWQYSKQDGFTTYLREGYLYPEFLRIVRAFQDFYGLNDFTFKQIDKFLLYQGGTLLSKRDAIEQKIEGGLGVEL
jgi:hypothetical protein